MSSLSEDEVLKVLSLNFVMLGSFVKCEFPVAVFPCGFFLL